MPLNWTFKTQLVVVKGVSIDRCPSKNECRPVDSFSFWFLSFWLYLQKQARIRRVSVIFMIDKVKKNGSDCEEWRWGPCIPNSKDCGVGFREGTCQDETKKLKCKIPCNWKKEFGADCKYKFENWGGCDPATGLKARSGTLKKALYNAECQETIQVTKPCSPKTKSKSKGQCSCRRALVKPLVLYFSCR
ncbi:hypothetical protein Chor_016570 [Crotalus horridus]